MILSQLHIHQLRNLSDLRLEWQDRFNLISGTNGSGKTSILEAIALLGLGHSFRSRDIASIIQHDRDTLTVFGRFNDLSTISIQKSLNQPCLVKINNQYCRSASELASLLPIQIFYQDIFQIIDAGPMVRRQLLDWGMFHVKHSYLALWKDYARVLKQRNSLLKQKAARSSFTPWNKQLAEIGESLHLEREAYFIQWQEAFNHILKQFTDLPCSLSYFKGWDKRSEGEALASILEASYDKDCQRQYTQQGPHQADIIIKTEDHKAKLTFSRGQQKLILYCLKLAQAKLLDSPCLYLFDDFSAELDKTHQVKILKYLDENQGQYFLTSIETGFLQELIPNIQNIALG